MLLESDFEVLASVSDGCTLLKAANILVPGNIVTDISMPCLSGIRAARQPKVGQPPSRIVFLTVQDGLVFLAEGRADLWVM